MLSNPKSLKNFNLNDVHQGIYMLPFCHLEVFVIQRSEEIPALLIFFSGQTEMNKRNQNKCFILSNEKQ